MLFLSDLLNSFFVGQAKPLLGEQRTKRQPYRLCRGARGWAELMEHRFLPVPPMASERRKPPSGCPGLTCRHKAHGNL
jgi:hypothetical protein